MNRSTKITRLKIAIVDMNDEIVSWDWINQVDRKSLPDLENDADDFLISWQEEQVGIDVMNFDYSFIDSNDELIDDIVEYLS